MNGVKYIKFHWTCNWLLEFCCFILFCAIKLSGDIGGSIGLYLGGSLLTLMEILDLIIWVCYKRERRPKVIQVAEKIEK